MAALASAAPPLNGAREPRANAGAAPSCEDDDEDDECCCCRGRGCGCGDEDDGDDDIDEDDDDDTDSETALWDGAPAVAASATRFGRGSAATPSRGFGPRRLWSVSTQSAAKPRRSQRGHGRRSEHATFAARHRTHATDARRRSASAAAAAAAAVAVRSEAAIDAAGCG